MTDSASNSDKEKLELEQLHLNNEKLKVELNKLRQDAKPDARWFRLLKNVGALGAAATVIATLYGIFDSYNKTIEDRRQSRISDQRTQIGESIKQLESSTTISRLIGLSVLSGYLEQNNSDPPDLISRLCSFLRLCRYQETNNNVHRQVLFALASLMASEKDPRVQAAVIDLINSIPKEGPITKAEWRYFQDLLVTQSRALMEKGLLPIKRNFGPGSPLSDEEQFARSVAKLIAINVRKSVVPNYTEFSGIYCEACDFHKIVFPEAVDFSGAVLDYANFSAASLKSAVFDNAEIAGTQFIEADLRNARFGTPLNGVNNVGTTLYLWHIVEALNVNAEVLITMPNFSCANLEGVDFGQHALFPAVIPARRTYKKTDGGQPEWYQSLSQINKDKAQKEGKVVFQPLYVTPPKFFKANMTNAHLEHTKFFTLVGGNDNPFNYIHNSTGPYAAEFSFLEGDIVDDAFQVRPKIDDERARFQAELVVAFTSVNVDKALLPPKLLDFLKKSKLDLEISASILSQARDPDLRCTPRRE